MEGLFRPFHLFFHFFRKVRRKEVTHCDSCCCLVEHTLKREIDFACAQTGQFNILTNLFLPLSRPLFVFQEFFFQVAQRFIDSDTGNRASRILALLCYFLRIRPDPSAYLLSSLVPLSFLAGISTVSGLLSLLRRLSPIFRRDGFQKGIQCLEGLDQTFTPLIDCQ